QSRAAVLFLASPSAQDASAYYLAQQLAYSSARASALVSAASTHCIPTKSHCTHKLKKQSPIAPANSFHSSQLLAHFIAASSLPPANKNHRPGTASKLESPDDKYFDRAR